MEVALINEKEWQKLTSSINQILTIVQGLQKQGGTEMVELDDLKAAVAKIQADVTAETTSINNAIADIQTLSQQLQAAIANNDPAAIESAAQSIAAVAASMEQSTTNLNNAVNPPAPTPAPAS